MNEDERRRELLEAVDRLTEAHQGWISSDAAYITDIFEATVDDVLNVFEIGLVPHDCRELARLAAALAAEWDRWQAQVAGTGMVGVLPQNAFWAALEAVEDASREARPQSVRPLESVAELDRQKVPHWQIARIYGWLDARGNPDTRKVEAELAKPGTHVAADFVPPHQRRREEEAARKESALRRLRESGRRKVEILKEPCPEPLEELVAQGVSLEQIARMTKRTTTWVLTECRRRGLPDPKSLDRPHAMRAPQERPLSAEAEKVLDAQTAALRSAGEEAGMRRDAATEEAEALGAVSWTEAEDLLAGETACAAREPTTEETIASRHAAGEDERAIAAALGVPLRRVRAVVKRYAEDPAAFAQVE